ncbi:MAG: ABC transporter ATP-binding protein [Halofilum sp. (in: g-proteobacteria)]
MTLRLEGVSKDVEGEMHIGDVDMTCEPGQATVLLGLTQAGKTTLMRLMAGLDRPGSGRILKGDRDVTRVPVRRRNVAMVYQQFINYPSLSVYDNIASPLKLARISRAEIDRRVRAEAERMQIDHLLERLPAELSGGQQQRTAMARALVRDAELLLLDEPLINLDYKLREQLREDLQRIFRERDTVIVYATTEPLEALTLGGTTAVMHEGRLVQHGPTPDVYHRPASVDVSQVFSDPPMNLFDGELDNGELSLGADARFTVPAHLHDLEPGRYRFGVRPGQMHLDDPEGARMALTGEVEVAEIAGSETYIHVRRGETAWVVQVEGVHAFGLGDPITVHIDPQRLYAFDSGGRLAAAPATVRAGAG